MKSFIKQYIFLVLLGFATLVSVFIALFYGIRFQGNDDVAMALISSGAYSGSVDNHLVYINFIYASMLNLFYYFIPSIEWYTFFFVVLNIISITFIAFKISTSSIQKMLKVIFLFFLASIFLQITADIQFTKTAAITAIAGIIFIIDEEGKKKYIGSILFILAALIRFDAAYLVLLLTSPFFLIGLLKIEKNSLFIKNRLILATIALSLVFQLADYAYYNSNLDWKYYLEYNFATRTINDNPTALMVADETSQYIPKNDYEAFLNFFPNPSVIDVEALNVFQLEIDKVPLKDKIINISQLQNHVNLLVSLLILTVVFIIFTKVNSKKMIITSMFIMMMLVLVYLSLSGIIKYRISFILLTTFVLLIPLLLKNQSIKPIGNIIILIVILTMSITLNNRFYLLKKQEKIHIEKNNDQELMINKYLSDKSKKIVPYLMGCNLSNKNGFNVSSNFPTDRIYFTGWLAHIPFNKNKFDSFSYYVDGYGLLVSKNNAKLAIKFVENSVNLNSGIVLTHKIVLESKDHVVVEFEAN